MWYRLVVTRESDCSAHYVKRKNVIIKHFDTAIIMLLKMLVILTIRNQHYTEQLRNTIRTKIWYRKETIIF